MIVVDASAVVDALTFAPGTDPLRAILRGEELHAPQLIDFEVVSAVRGLTLGGHLSAQRTHDALTDYTDLPIQRWPSTDALRQRTLDLRDYLSGYDAAYVVLAEALDCRLVTRDARLARSVGHEARIEAVT